MIASHTDSSVMLQKGGATRPFVLSAVLNVAKAVAQVISAPALEGPPAPGDTPPMLRLFALSLLAATAFAVGCVPVARDATCVAADACDQALERPTEDFAVTDPVFGDDLNGDGTAGVDLTDVGTCWQNAGSAAPCIAACQAFLDEQVGIAQGQNNVAVIEACGGDVEEE